MKMYTLAMPMDDGRRIRWTLYANGREHGKICVHVGGPWNEISNLQFSTCFNLLAHVKQVYFITPERSPHS